MQTELYRQIKSLGNNPTTDMLLKCETALEDWYASKDSPDFRLLKLLKNLQFYHETPDTKISYKNEMTHAIYETLRRTADYDINIRDYPEKVKERHENISKLCETMRSEQKQPVEEESDKPVDMTIFVVTYNQLELTKLCLDSVFKNTCDVSYELYLIDNGSSDGTYEYFQNDDRLKIIRLVENTGLLLALHIFYESNLDNGKFWMYMNNDVVVTPRWASNMLKCIKSDPHIASVMPVTNRAAAFACIQPPMGLYDVESVQAFGEKHNVSNPNLWQDWIMYYGFVLLSRPSFRRKMGYYEDCFYFPFYFSDGDITLSQTKAGYRTVQARDTYIHHFDGGHTVLSKRREALARGEKQFFNRHGFFSTDIEHDELPHPIALGFTAGATGGRSMSHAQPVNAASKILFLGRSRSHALMQLKSINKAMGIDHVEIYAADTMEFLKLEQQDEEVNFQKMDNWYELSDIFEGELFDAIVYLRGTMELRHPDKFFKAVYSRLNVNGKLFIREENTGNLLALNYILMAQRESPRDSVRIRKNDIKSFGETISLLTDAGFYIDAIEDVFYHENFTFGKLESVENYRKLYKKNHGNYDMAAFERNMLTPFKNIVARKPSVIDTENTLEQLLYTRKTGG